jgi:hypothetical protein
MQVVRTLQKACRDLGSGRRTSVHSGKIRALLYGDFALRSRQPIGPCRSQNRSSRRRASLSRHYCDPAPCLASSRDRPWSRHCKEPDRCGFIRDAPTGRTSTVRPRVGARRHRWPAVIAAAPGHVDLLPGRGGSNPATAESHNMGAAGPYPGVRGVGRGAPAGSRSPAWPVSSPATGVPRRPISDPNPAHPTAGADGKCVETAGEAARLHRIGRDTGQHRRFESGGART